MDTYPVGLLLHLRLLVGCHRIQGGRRRLYLQHARQIGRTIRRYVATRNWHALRQYANGYLCEHIGHHHNAGRGWTKRTAQRRAQTICHAAASRS